jgi:hypothetical protein
VIGSRVRLALAAMVVTGWIAAPSAQDPTTPPVSLDRVRAALAKPPALTLTHRPPDFTVHIEKRRPMQDIFDVPPWATDPVGWQPPGIGLDLGMVFRYFAKVKRGHDERLAREEVQRSIADYCAAQPNLGAGIQICGTRPR